MWTNNFINCAEAVIEKKAGPHIRANRQSPSPHDVIHTISTPHGQVQRIVVFKKNGVQAMVEYPFQQIVSSIVVWCFLDSGEADQHRCESVRRSRGAARDWPCPSARCRSDLRLPTLGFYLFLRFRGS
ncbi:Heterogeneous nuclear ribonucleoprotein L-like [Eumeta japonica]|uniref:Heterogeneous nuclear ribonucleoprotein L-like n=1 Tax=Eumeta variegata TaxID=151549 RepID=A0A4C2A5Q2_EUMVA|nr:Heterogeneous nuclear ribonucleoprotein L-like [Eumeta japonica]